MTEKIEKLAKELFDVIGEYDVPLHAKWRGGERC